MEERRATLHAAGGALQRDDKSPSNDSDQKPHPGTGLVPKHLVQALEDAGNLLKYAAEVGIDVDEDVRRKIVDAGMAAANATWSQQHSLDLLAGLTALSHKLDPVSGESLRKCERGKEATKTLRAYKWVAIALAGLIVPYSICAFVASARCEGIEKDIETANALAVSLATNLHLVSGTPSSPDRGGAQYNEEELPRLQQFTAIYRALDARAWVLKSFAFGSVSDPFAKLRGNRDELDELFELPTKRADLASVAREKIRVYQQVRYFAKGVQETVSTSFGAVTSGLLPILYALLGACAFLIRCFEGQIKSKTFTGAHYSIARFLIAGIGGLVVGLFGNFAYGHGTTLPPLAIAFLVGYAVDVFFSFLEGLLRSFGQSADAPPSADRSSSQTKIPQPSKAI